MVFIYLFMVRASQEEFAIPILCTTCVLGSVSLSPVVVTSYGHPPSLDPSS